MMVKAVVNPRNPSADEIRESLGETLSDLGINHIPYILNGDLKFSIIVYDGPNKGIGTIYEGEEACRKFIKKLRKNKPKQTPCHCPRCKK